MARSVHLRSLPRAAAVFAALGDETRLRLLLRLGREGPLSITRLTEGEATTRQALTKHLRLLEEVGLAARTKDGREQRYALSEVGVAEAEKLLGQISRQWDEALLRLKSFVEK